MNDRLIEIYRSCRPKEALASQDQYQSANALLGSEVEKFAELIVKECENSIKLVPTHYEAQDKIIVECLKAIRETFRS